MISNHFSDTDAKTLRKVTLRHLKLQSESFQPLKLSLYTEMKALFANSRF